MKKLQAFLLSLLAVACVGGMSACELNIPGLTNGNSESQAESSIDESQDGASVSDEDEQPSDEESDASENEDSESTTDSESENDESTDDSENEEEDNIELSDAATVLPAAYALEVGKQLEGTYVLRGQITNMGAYNEKYGDINLTIVIEGYEEYPMYCYALKGEEVKQLGLGYIITVSGSIKNYNNTIEFDKPQLLAWEEGSLAPAIDVTPSAGTGIAEGYQVITVEQALAIAAVTTGATTERYYIHANINTVSNAEYGAMTISDETGSIYVYGTYSEDGSVKYKDMEFKPAKGDEVLLHCTLKNHEGSLEVNNARLIAYQDIEVDQSAYTEMTIAEAREAEEDSLVKVSGIVADITYATGMVPSGVYLVDETNSIYVYDRDLAANVEVGNSVTIVAEKTWWILADEQAYAEKFGYIGCNQLEDAYLIENAGGEYNFDFEWIEGRTVKQIMDTPVSEDITTTIYVVNALIKKSEGTGFTNYYIDDLDGRTGNYVYTQCNGSDLNWMQEFDGKICTVYLSVINAKSTAAACNWRFIPLKIVDEGYTFNTDEAAQFALDYYAVEQFETVYTADPELELIPSVSSELLGFENVTLSYESSDSSIVWIDTAGEAPVFHCGEAYGTATVTITATYGEITATATVEITHEVPPDIDYISVADAIATAADTDVVVKGIVGPSLVNQSGFYLFSEEGDMIAVKLASSDTFSQIAMGNEIIVKGMRERYVKDDSATTYIGQTCIVDAELLLNNQGNHAYCDDKFVEGKTIADLYALDATVDYSTTVFVVTGTISFPTGYGAISIVGEDGSTFSLYHNGVKQYGWLENYTGTVTLEIAACNWNSKTYWRGCVLAIRLEDGTKICNTLNFNA